MNNCDIHWPPGGLGGFSKVRQQNKTKQALLSDPTSLLSPPVDKSNQPQVNNPDSPDSPDNLDNPDNPDSPDSPDSPDNPDNPDNPRLIRKYKRWLRDRS